MKYTHFIITRYNLGLYATKAIKDKDKWMEDRYRLFTDYCIPSIEAQTNKDFVWVILLDSKTKSVHLTDITDNVPENAVVFINKWPDIGRFDEKNCEQDHWKVKFVKLCKKIGCEYAAMTRLDNDDALVNDFVESMRIMIGTIREIDNAVIDCNCGMFYDEINEKAYLINHPYGSPFITYIQKVEDGMNTVYNRCHRDVAISTQNRHNIHSRSPMWVEVIHENNKSNRIIDKMIKGKVKWSEYKGGFGL